MKVFFSFLLCSLFFNNIYSQYDANHGKIFTSLEEALHEDPLRVYYLDLKQKDISVFPKEVLRFEHLIHLNLAHNSIRNLDGIDLSMMTDLEEIILYDNKLRIFPYETLDQVPNLKILDIGENDIKALEAPLSKLRYLEKLDLSGNRIATIDQDIVLPYLASIKLERNYLHEFPVFLLKAKKLSHLNVYGNQLKTIPESLNTFSKLNYLNIGDNPISNISEAISLRKLNTLILDWIDLSKEELNIDFITNSNKLEILSMEHCQLSTIPSFVFSLRQLKELSILNNEIRSIDTQLFNHKKLSKCWLSGNYIEVEDIITLQKKCVTLYL